MDDVTDTVFRQIVASTAKPDLFMTEFANADGYCSKGRDNIMGRLIFSATEQPLVAQIWGMNPNNFYTFAKDLKKMGFVGIDINMGCPERGIVKRGACSALINNPELAKQMISSVRRAVGNNYPLCLGRKCGVVGLFENHQLSPFL